MSSSKGLSNKSQEKVGQGPTESVAKASVGKDRKKPVQKGEKGTVRSTRRKAKPPFASAGFGSYAAACSTGFSKLPKALSSLHATGRSPRERLCTFTFRFTLSPSV